MSDPTDAPRLEPADAAEETGARRVAGKDTAGQKPSSRPPAEIRADLFRERAELGASFDALRADLDDAVDGARRRAGGIGRKARIIAPAVGAALATAIILRRRARNKR